MKYLLVFLFIYGTATAQDHPKCDSGYSWMPSISTSSLIIEGNRCVPDSVYKKLWLLFSKNACGESGFAALGGTYSHGVTSRWVNDSVGCVTRERFEKRVKGKWVEISKCRYYYENKDEKCWSGSKDAHMSCCGHVHITAPE